MRLQCGRTRASAPSWTYCGVRSARLDRGKQSLRCELPSRTRSTRTCLVRVAARCSLLAAGYLLLATCGLRLAACCVLLPCVPNGQLVSSCVQLTPTCRLLSLAARRVPRVRRPSPERSHDDTAQQPGSTAAVGRGGCCHYEHSEHRHGRPRPT